MAPQGNFDGVRLSMDERTVMVGGTTVETDDVKKMYVSLAYAGELLHPLAAVPVDDKWSATFPNATALTDRDTVTCVGIGFADDEKVFMWSEDMPVQAFEEQVAQPPDEGGPPIDDLITPPDS